MVPSLPRRVFVQTWWAGVRDRLAAVAGIAWTDGVGAEIAAVTSIGGEA